MSAAWVTAATALAAAVAGLGAWAARMAWRVITRTLRFLDDWAGESARPGVPSRPGVVESIASLRAQVAEIKAETRPNGGTSLRDVVHRTADDVADIKREQVRVRAELAKLQKGSR